MIVGLVDELVVRKSAFLEAYRLVPSRFPPVTIFDELVAPEEIDVLQALESRTNDRLDLDQLGEAGLIAPEDRVVGPGTTPVMAAFAHPNRSGSRFTDGRFGVYYCAARVDTAIKEVAFHRARFLRESREPACQIEMRCYVGRIRKHLHDGIGHGLDDKILDPDSYHHSQPLGAALRDAGAYGLTYPSVRDPDGMCAALFRPPAIPVVQQTTHYRFDFDGQRITDVVELGAHTSL